MQDFFNIDSQLSDDERAVRDSVRRFVDEKVLPIIGNAYVEGRFPKEIIPEMAELGVLGANLPEEYGCAGLNNVAYGLIMQELERGDSGIRSFASVQGALAMYPIYAFGSEEQKKKFLPGMAAGKIIGCFGLTEPDYGSNPSGMITMAKEQKDGSWILNGAKMWITNGSQAHLSVVWAKTNGDASDKSIRGFIVPTDSKGFKAKDQKGKLSLRASDTSELVFDEVHLPKDALLPKSGGLKSPLMCLTQARYGISWGAIGAAIACYEEALLRGQPRDVRPADRRVPDPAGPPRRHAHRDYQGAAGVVAPRPAQGRRHVHARAGLARQAQQRQHGHGYRPRGAASPRRRRNPRRVFSDATHGEPGVGLHLRGYARRPFAHPRTGRDWAERVQVRRSGANA
jgi:alkylation response protein AidB-like acyl-CoA dehydrogenase